MSFEDVVAAMIDVTCCAYRGGVPFWSFASYLRGGRWVLLGGEEERQGLGGWVWKSVSRRVGVTTRDHQAKLICSGYFLRVVGECDASGWRGSVAL